MLSGMLPAINDGLIQPYQENFTLGSLGIPRYFFGSLTIVFQDADPDPPVADRAAEAQHFRGFVASGKAVG